MGVESRFLGQKKMICSCWHMFTVCLSNPRNTKFLAWGVEILSTTEICQTRRKRALCKFLDGCSSEAKSSDAHAIFHVQSSTWTDRYACTMNGLYKHGIVKPFTSSSDKTPKITSFSPSTAFITLPSNKSQLCSAKPHTNPALRS